MGHSSPYSTLILIALMVVAFYFLIIRPNKKRQQAQQQTMSSLTPGTRVLLTSGVFGTLVEIGQKQAVLELSPGVHITVLKQAIARAARDTDEDSAVEDGADEPDALDDMTPFDEDLSSSDVPSRPVTQPGTLGTPPATGSGSTAVGSDRSRGTDADPRTGTNTSPIQD